MNGMSPWAAAVKDIFDDQDLPVIFKQMCGSYAVKVHNISNALFIAITCPNDCQVVLRAAFAPTDHLRLTKFEERDNGALIWLTSSIGLYEVNLEFPAEDQPLLRYTTTFKAAGPLLFPFWPRDMVITFNDVRSKNPEGKVHISQSGTRAGLQYISMEYPKSGTLLYFQNLTALNDYCQATKTSAANVVGGQWPELGFALPPALEKPIPAGKKIVLSDAFLAFCPESPENEMGLAKQFMNLLATIYLHLPRPATEYHKWPDILDHGLSDLENSHACWSHASGHDYLNAYACDYNTPPEIMVQLAVLLPMLEYHRWGKREMPAVNAIKSGISAFYNEKIGTMVRWLPSLAEDLDGSEEQLKPNVMDSWYLHHPLLHLSQIALLGDKDAEKLFLDSLSFTIKVAHHFDYEWPVFYDMETLEVIKAETKPGKGGEKDVAGLYAYVMLYAWKLTKERKYLLEAKKAAKTLQSKGFELFYQANNTAFAANAMLWLYRETNDHLYLDLSYLCLANILKNVQLWECNYGYAKEYPTFFGVFPLSDAPYTAAYEEQEVFSAIHNYLVQAEGQDILPSVSLMLAEFIRYVVQRSAFYYPPNLPKEMLSDEVKMGQLDPDLWMAIEDIHDGWEKSGAVGQEVYGAGVAFGIVPRHYHQVPGEPFMIYIDYPIADFTSKKSGIVSFRVKGDEKLNCRMMIIKNNQEKLPGFSVTATKNSGTEVLQGKPRKDGHMEYNVFGNRIIKIAWHKNN